MAWPQPTDYHEAVQNPQRSFRDAELGAGEVAADALGMPRTWSGNFADVYQIRGPGSKSWAVKCFTREVGSLQARYQAISAHLSQGSPPFMVQFHYLTDGIRIGNKWYPVLKMDWVEGFTLSDFVRRHADKPQVMYRLAQMWIKLSLQLRRAKMAHADLQHGNVLLVPGERASQLNLRLIDYDGMWVPALAHAPSGEVGHPNYQHPERLRDGAYGAEVDRFSHLLIYTALRALTVGKRPLWEKYDNGENLLFREQDFTRPGDSALLVDLWQLPDADLRHLVGHLLLGSQRPLDKVAMLDDVVGSEGRPVPVTAAQEREILEMLPAGAARLKTPPVELPRLTLEQLVASTDDEPLDGTAPGPNARWSRRTEWLIVVGAVLGGVACLGWALALLPGNGPGLFGILGGLAAMAAAALMPLASALLINACLGHRLPHADLHTAFRWLNTNETCPRCGCTNVMPLFTCRLCGRMNWVQLGVICTFAATCALLVAVSQPQPQIPGWWVVLTILPRWLGRFAAVAAAFLLVIGTFNAWHLQPRLPKEQRLRSQAGLTALLGATLLPVFVAGLLIFSLFTH